jgi:ABC-type transport system substrate-binding protein
VLIDGGYNYEGDTYKPDFDMYIWQWQPSGSDPGRRLGYFRSIQVENQNDACWANAEYDALWEQQAQELDPQARKEIVWKMQEIFYTESPYIVLTYPKTLQGWNTAQWEGWTRIPEGVGAVAYLSDNVQNYALVQPAGAAAEEGGTGAGTIVLIVVVAAVVLALVVWLVLRGRGGRAEEV